MKLMRLCLLLCVLVLGACGGKPDPLSPAQHELDQKHCNSNADCASGLCRAGRCG